MIVLSLLLAGTIAEPLRRLVGGRRARAPRRQGARGDPRLHRPPGRDRPSLRRAARHDQRALQPHRGDRELRRRRRARAEEPADLAAQRGRDPAARQDRGVARPAARRHPARRAPPRPADHRHLRRLAPRRRTGARGGRAASTSCACSRPSSRSPTRCARDDGVDIELDIAPRPRGRDALLRHRATTAGSARSSPISIDNARSFSPPGRRRCASPLRRAGARASRSSSTTTARAFRAARTSSASSSASTPTGPEQGFGQNSGLGLSISRQIVEAHRRPIWAENRCRRRRQARRRAPRRALHVGCRAAGGGRAAQR